MPAAQPANATGPQASTSETSSSAVSSSQRPDSTSSTARSAISSAASRAAGSSSTSSQKKSESAASRMRISSSGRSPSPSGPLRIRTTRPYDSARRLVTAPRVATARTDNHSTGGVHPPAEGADSRHDVAAQPWPPIAELDVAAEAALAPVAGDDLPAGDHADAGQVDRDDPRTPGRRDTHAVGDRALALTPARTVNDEPVAIAGRLLNPELR